MRHDFQRLVTTDLNYRIYFTCLEDIEEVLNVKFIPVEGKRDHIEKKSINKQ